MTTAETMGDSGLSPAIRGNGEEAAPVPEAPPASIRTPPPASEDPAAIRDLALVEAANAGKAAALEELLTRHQERVYSSCYRLLGDPDLAADAAQDAMIKVIRGLPRFEARSRFSTWVTRIAINASLSLLRRERVRRHASLDAPGPTGEGSASDTPDRRGSREAGDDAAARESTRRVYAALDTLEQDHRVVLVLRDMHDLDYATIGEILGVASGTVKSRIFRARIALRRAFEAGLPSVTLGRDGEPAGEGGVEEGG